MTEKNAGIRKGIISGFVLVLLSGFVNAAHPNCGNPPTTITECCEITVSGMYALSNTLDFTDDSESECIAVYADNVELNGNRDQGYWILNKDSGSSDVGVKVYGDRVELYDFNIDMKESVGGHAGVGIHLYNAKYAEIRDNYLKDVAGGIRVQNGRRNSIYDNNIENVGWTGNADYGIKLESTTDNQLWDNIVYPKFDGCEYGIWLRNADRNTFIDDLLRFHERFDVYDVFAEYYSTDNTFLSVDYDTGKEQVSADSDLTREWHYRAYVKDDSGGVFADAQVRAVDADNILQFTLSTDATGYTDITSIVDYVNDGGSRDYLSDYRITASLPDSIAFCSLSDIDRGGYVGPEDLSALASHWGFSDCHADNDWCNRTDITKDGLVDSADLSTLATNWGNNCYPKNLTHTLDVTLNHDVLKHVFSFSLL